MTSVVAALIVKNEEAVLWQCLTSLQPHVQHIVVNDNGSTDGTPAILEKFGCVQVPGNWVDFSTNRNLVLNVARAWGDYVLAGIDADETFITSDGWTWPKLDADAYMIECRYEDMHYNRLALVRSSVAFQWRFPIHEILGFDGPHTTSQLQGAYIQVGKGGARSKDPTTQARDLTVLLQAAQDNPNEPRFRFYTAQTFKDMGQYKSAMQNYSMRIAMGGGSIEEIWYSHFMIARCKEWMGEDPIEAYIKAYEVNPLRAEPLYYVADWCRRKEYRELATMFGRAAIMPMPKGLFVEADIYNWRVFDLIASVAWYSRDPSAGKYASEQLLLGGKFPESQRARIERNAATYL